LALIEKYGADGVRMGMMLSAPAGNDILFDEALCEQGRNFNNKIWNALRLIKGWSIADQPQSEASAIAIRWFDAKLNEAIVEINDLFDKYRISEALMTVYKLFWDEFSSWYLELIKPGFQQPIDAKTFDATRLFFEKLLKLLHPFMPFITEELYHALDDRDENDCIMISLLPEAEPFDKKVLEQFEFTKEIIASIRTIRLQKNIPNKEPLMLQILQDETIPFESVIKKMGNINQIERVDIKQNGAASFIVGTIEFAIPTGSLTDINEEIKKITEELHYLEGFLDSVNKKLSNDRFVTHAKPEVVEMERKKRSDAESKIATLKATLSTLTL
jgi:valyl-tRNA synthetase